MNLWVIAFPCLMLLASVGAYLSSPRIVEMLNDNVGNTGTGILTMYPIVIFRNPWPTIPYLSISLSLNVILTLMIVVRLILHGRSVRAATGSPGGISGLYKTISSMLIESSALFAVNSLLAIGTWVPAIPATNVFTIMLGVTQVRAFL